MRVVRAIQHALGARKCRCGHARRQHLPAWSWTGCMANPTTDRVVPEALLRRLGPRRLTELDMAASVIPCRCDQFRWVRARWWWDFRYRRAEGFGWRRG